MRAKREWLDGQDRFRVFQFEVPAFEFNWHYHSAYELTWIRKGQGTRYVGDVVQPFQRNDLVLIRSEVPHTWHSVPKRGQSVAALVIHFSDKLLQPLGLFPEWDAMRKLVDTGVGTHFQLTPELRRLLTQLEVQRPAKQLIDFWALLYALTQAKPTRLKSAVYRTNQATLEHKRISQVLQYIHQHAASTITLPDLCRIVGLSHGAFCRFFKQQTQQTPMQYLLEFRLRRAAQLLIETDEAVGWIATQVGFNDQAYFTRMFVRQYKCAPLRFRNQQGTHLHKSSR